MRRSTAIALILLALLGGLYWYSTQEDNLISAALAGTPTPSPAPPEYLVEPFTKTLSALSVQLTSGEQLRLEFSNGIWTAQNAQGSLENIDQAAAATAAMSLQELLILAELEAENNLADFGLQPAATAEIEATFSDGTTLFLQVGNATPTSSGYYALESGQPNQIRVLPQSNLNTLLSLPLNPPIVIPTPAPENPETP